MDIRLPWAKSADDGSGRIHPLICHMVDVAGVCATLWSTCLKPGLKRRTAEALGLSIDDAGWWMALCAGAHDLGKASPAFQDAVPSAARRLRGAGLSFPRTTGRTPHGFVTVAALRTLLAETGPWPSLSADLALRVATAVGGHHGVFPRVSEWLSLGSREMGDPEWAALRRCLLEALVEALPPPRALATLSVPRLDHAFFMLLAGLTSVSDWIGSAEDYFTHAGVEVDLGSYAVGAAGRAERALVDLGWTAWQGIAPSAGFTDLFPRIDSPRPLQVQVSEVGLCGAEPGLVLIEAPTGEGKTEAALFLSDHWRSCLDQQGLYVALPTQATSNQMFERVCEFLQDRYPEERVNTHLLHGRAAVSGQYRALRLAALHDETPTHDGATARVVAEEWFARRKRGLLAPFAVGTIDQALLAVLQTRHVFVRLFGLSSKTVILDEVHAYDAYMSTLLQHLLQWLAALGSSVVLLSATLPKARREALVAAYLKGLGQNEPMPRVPHERYPRIVWARRNSIHASHVETSDPARRSLALDWVPEAMGEANGRTPSLITRLRRALKEGGCAAVICNTVARAQTTFKTLTSALGGNGTPVALLHARFPFGQRDHIEKQVLDWFGKGGDRPRTAILVATQVIEQSLDLDFDLMVTDLAPVDLMLQRAGRLHRHKRTRPAPLRAPTLWILEPGTGRDGVPDFGPSEWVYPRYLLLRSYLALSRLQGVDVPEDVEGLIESVYGEAWPEPPDDAWRTALAESGDELSEKRAEHEAKAQRVLIKPPDYSDDILQDFCQELEEDDPTIHPSLQALTRLSLPSVTVICLRRGSEGLVPWGAGDPIDLAREPSPDDIRRLLHASLSLSHRTCVTHFACQEAPSSWKRCAHLRHLRPAELDGDGTMPVADGYVLRLDQELGAIVERPSGG